nr:hypothetical protein [Rhodococcus sp. 15-1154-1]
MIRPIVAFRMKGWQITCDSCGNKANFYENTARAALVTAQGFSWRKWQSKHLCPSC